MKPIISVIVPIYNTEQYLPMCIDSILAQSFEDFELILVNDGSPDNSAQICEQYHKRDSRIKIINKKNGGISSARNAGLELATGDYIVFVDSDDFIESDFLKIAYTRLTETNVDLYIGGFCEMHDSDGRKVPRCIEHKKQYSTSELLNQYDIDYPAYWLSLVWGKLYKAEIIRTKQIKFDLQLSYKEDALFVFSYLKYVNHIYFDSEIVCNYRIFRSGSLNLKIHTNMYEINCKVYKQKRELMIEKKCNANVYDHVYFGSLMNSIEYFYMSDCNESKAQRYNTITAVCHNEILPQIAMRNVSGVKRKLMLSLCKIKAKKIIAAMYWLRSMLRN